jgi:hypothetical protein
VHTPIQSSVAAAFLYCGNFEFLIKLMLSKLYFAVIASAAKQTSILHFWFASGFALAMTIRQFLVNITIEKNNSIFPHYKIPQLRCSGWGYVHHNRALTHPATKMTALRAWLVCKNFPIVVKIFQSL